MRFLDLENKNDDEQNELIVKSPECKAETVLDNPKLLEKKILVFRGNYDGYATDRLCARTLEYISSEERWKVSDIILHEMFRTEFWHHFTTWELKSKFPGLCVSTGFLMDFNPQN